MNIEKEREAFQEWFGTTTTYQTLWDFISTHQTNIKSVFVKKNGKTYQNDCVQIAWEAWQAAKASAVPDGYVVVPEHVEINLGNGLSTICDWCDFDSVNKYSWFLVKKG